MLEIPKFRWEPIKRKHPTSTPWGYESDPEDYNLLLPLYDENLNGYHLDYLEEAKNQLANKRLSSRQVAMWLSAVTGKELSHSGLLKRIKTDNQRF